MSLKFSINKENYSFASKDFPPDTTLNTFIREHAGLSGTKFMCLEAGCGVCVVVVKGKHPANGEIKTWAVNSCLTLLNACDGFEITTIEGLGNRKDGYHPIQKRLAELNGTQCGYCSPAMVMNMHGLLESKNGKITMEEVENSFGGSLCRCTGYRPILDAMKSFASNCEFADYNVVNISDIEDLNKKVCPKTNDRCLGKCRTVEEFSRVILDDDREWYQANSLQDVFKTFNEIGDKPYILLGGNTAHGVIRRSEDIKAFIDINKIIDLHSHQVTDTQIKLGGNVNLTEAMEIFMKNSTKKGFEYLTTVWDHFDIIANVPVRNMGTLAGNLMIKNAHIEFPSDVFISFEALQAKIEIMESPTTIKSLNLLEFLKTDMRKKVILSFILPSYSKDEFIYNSYKIMPRAQNAHAYVNAAFLIQLGKDKKVKSANLCFGGISPEFVHATELEKYLIGKPLFDNTTFGEIFKNLKNVLKPDWVLPDASPQYRTYLACGLLFKALIANAPKDKVPKNFVSGGTILKRDLSSGVQTFETIEKNYPLTKPVVKLEALIQTAGEAFYMNDLPNQPRELWCAFVHATQVNSKIVSIDAKKALEVPGVVAFFSAKDIPGKNSFTNNDFFPYEDEEIFCSSNVIYYNQPAGVIVAQNTAIAEKAAKLVQIMYEKQKGAALLVTMQDVFDNKAHHRIFDAFQSTYQIRKFPDLHATKKIESFFDLGTQYHFTMEPQTTVCLPRDNGMEVYTANQWLDFQQIGISRCLDLPQNNIELQVRRVGGGYGAKISRSTQIACACAIACHKLNRPIRFVQTIESMMGCLGKRFACHSDYEAQFEANGKITNLKNVFYEDAGCTLSEAPTAFLTVVAAKNCYETNDKWDISGKTVKTDAPSNTWCRAPGALEGIGMIETIMEHIAFENKLDPVDVRYANIAPNHRMRKLLDDFITSIKYRERRKAVEDFNKNNRWKKRGLGIAVMQYPIEYFGSFTSIVAIFHNDGSVGVTHSGVEMGQGINTKVAQAVAYTLEIPLEKIKIMPTDSFSSANGIVSGGGVASESAAYAARKAARILKDRLKPLQDAKPNAKWEEIVADAFSKHYNLSAQSQVKPSDLKEYNVWGLATTEVEVDILTGNHIIKQVDILEDTGESLSPLIDIGQIEGAFVMGLGYWLTEQCVFNRQTGELLTTRTWNYKVPGVKDIPIDFRINLLQKAPNPNGFLRSKTTGEPAACLSISAMFAIRQACFSARADAGIENKWLPFGAPTTPEHVVLNSGTSMEMLKF